MTPAPKQLRIDYLIEDDADGNPDVVPLLSSRQRASFDAYLAEAAKDLAEAEKEADAKDVDPDAIRAEIDATRAILSRDAAIRERASAEGRVVTAVFAIAAPTLAARHGIDEQGLLPHQGAKLARACYEALAPHVVSGWEGELPVAFYEVLAGACVDALYPKLTGKQLFLSSKWGL